MAQHTLSAVKRKTVVKQSFGKAIRRYWVGYALILPALIFRLLLTGVPLIQTIWMSFTDKTMTRPGSWIGLDNYARMSQDYLFRASIEVTFIYTFAATLLELVIGLGIALLLIQGLRGTSLTQTVMLMPWAVAPLVAALMFRLLFFEAGGVFNDLVLRFDLSSTRVPWLSDPTMARISVIVTTVWKNVPWAVLLLLAGLKAIPKRLYESAAVDGAGPLQRFRHITLPLLLPILLVVLLIRGVAEVQTFEQILALTQGGPGTATGIISLYAYERLFQQFNFGYGSALTVLLLLLSVLIAGSMTWLINRENRRH